MSDDEGIEGNYGDEEEGEGDYGEESAELEEFSDLDVEDIE